MRVEEIEIKINNGGQLSKAELAHMNKLVRECRRYFNANDVLRYYKTILLKSLENKKKQERHLTLI